MSQGNHKSQCGVSNQLRDELGRLGLTVVEVEGDGSCFFRSLADQLDHCGGHEEECIDHQTLRQRIMSYVRAHRTMYEPFMEDDEPFDDYVNRMEENGEWAGNVELQAASMELGVNIRIYQEGQTPWTIKNHPDSAPLLHLSYHDGSHYNSVRSINGLTQASDVQQVKDAAADAVENIDKTLISKASRKFSTEENYVRVLLTLIGKGRRQRIKVRVIATASQPKTHASGQEQMNPVPARNTQCPCGSKRKYKNCCGSGRGIVGQKSGSQRRCVDIDELSCDVETLYI
jgi:OTU domain-containing protein 3